MIPAAGLGSRFLPLTAVHPKELLPLGTKPLIHHALEEAERAGFDGAVIVLSPAKDAIRRYFEHSDASSIAERMQLRFAEQPQPLGLGDAVLKGLAEIDRAEPFAVLLPDDVVPESEHWLRLRRLHDSTSAPCLCVREVPLAQAHRFGIAVCSERDGWLHVDSLVEKPPPGTSASNLSIFGRYIVTQRVVAALEGMRSGGSELQLTDGFAAVLGEPPGVGAVEFRGELYDAGTPAEYALANARYGQLRGG
jgi:UTP--glucose-1-phosphate uridylyltransferase